MNKNDVRQLFMGHSSLMWKAQLRSSPKNYCVQTVSKHVVHSQHLSSPLIGH